MSFPPVFEPCTVTAYSGHRANERPASFAFEGAVIDVLRLHATRIEEDLRTRARRRFFIALGSDGREYRLRHDMETDEWFAARERAG